MNEIRKQKFKCILQLKNLVKNCKRIFFVDSIYEKLEKNCFYIEVERTGRRGKSSLCLLLENTHPGKK